ncbi:basement membrane-specific heparan sulfate proteoglycan core protein-like [Carcharodon carcharias]|uniref:basement membrane-specific heparan sulfate proteoglycan core protein-like n=1 Tax=Carcharodon carcharias TaxID=13397 RepID=UPI001B7F3DB2|nr:basement membrane-specific heparan sulfate proteoglycan core protein-like [Carcharodon carcharias]
MDQQILVRMKKEGSRDLVNFEFMPGGKCTFHQDACGINISGRNNDELTQPEISLDQPAGVCLETEYITINCTARANYFDKTFYIYKDNQALNISPASKKDKFVMCSIPALNQEGRYQCRYGVSVLQSRSPLSETVMVTIEAGFILGPSVQRRPLRLSNKRNSPFQNPHAIIRGVDRSEIGSYSCCYKALINGSKLSSALSDPVHIIATAIDDMNCYMIAIYGPFLFVAFFQNDTMSSGSLVLHITPLLNVRAISSNSIPIRLCLAVLIMFVIVIILGIEFNPIKRKRDCKACFNGKQRPSLDTKHVLTSEGQGGEALALELWSKCTRGGAGFHFINSSSLFSVFFAIRRSVSQEPLRKPVITLDQSTGVYVIGETVTMTCTVTGDDRDKTFYFYKDGVRQYSRRNDTRDNTRTFPVTDKRGEGRYQCQYQISIGGPDSTSPKSEAVNVTTTDRLEKPRINLNKRNGVYVIGETVTITCTVIGDVRKKTFYFYKDEELQVSRQIVTKVNIGTVQVTGRSSEGRYRCQYEIVMEGRHLISTKSEAVTVITTDPLKIPVISLDQKTGVYAVGETITMTCTVTGDNRQKRFYFYKRYQQLSSSPYITKTNTLTFANTSPSHSGQYQCKYRTAVQSRQFDSKQSQAVLVTIAALPIKPVITLNQPTGVYLPGEKGSITCIVTGDKRDKFFKFYRNNELLHFAKTGTQGSFVALSIGATYRGGQYRCQYSTSINSRLLVSPISEAVTVTMADPLKIPVISLDQKTGVYAVGETITMTCTVTGDNRQKRFDFYKGYRHLSSSPYFTSTNTLTFANTSPSHSGQYQCKYRTAVQSRQFDSKQSQSVTVTIVDPLKIPVISLDQKTGVYAVGETITMTCTVTGDNRQKRFDFYKGYRQLSSSPYFTSTNTLTFANTSPSHSGQYQCKYRTAVQSRQFDSKQSKAVSVTIAELPEPYISVDSSAVIRSQAVTFKCTSPGDNPAITFYLYRQGDANHYGIKPAASGINSVTFTIRNVDHSEIGNYTCRYEALINGRNLSSAQSDAVHITVTDKKHVALAVGIGSAAGLILLLALLGVCLWRKGKNQSNLETRNAVPSGDLINENVTYAVLNLQTMPKRHCQRQRDNGQAQSEDFTIYAAVKL